MLTEPDLSSFLMAFKIDSFYPGFPPLSGELGQSTAWCAGSGSSPSPHDDHADAQREEGPPGAVADPVGIGVR